METQITSNLSHYNLKEMDITNKHIIINGDLYHCTKHSKLYLFLNKLNKHQQAHCPTDIVFQTADGDCIDYVKFSPEIKEEKIKKLISSLERSKIYVITNINYDYYYKIEKSRFNTNETTIIKTKKEYKKDFYDNGLISAYRDYYSVVSRTTNIYGEKTNETGYYESFIKKYAGNLLHHINYVETLTDDYEFSYVKCREPLTDDYVYNLVGEHYKEFKHQEIKPVLEHLRNATKKSLSFKVITDKKMGEDALCFSRYFKYETIKTETGYEFKFENKQDYESAKDLTSYRWDFKDPEKFKWVF